MQQPSMLDLMVSPPIRMAVNPDGPVVQGEPHETLRLPHPRLAWDQATIELHRHENGMWMWSAGYNTGRRGGGFKVGPKWGRFANTRDDALHHARAELLSRLDAARADDDREASTMRQIADWARGLT